MNLKFWHRSSLSRLSKDKRTSGPGLLARLLRDEEGSYLLYMTVAIPVFIGFAGFASEGSLLLYNHRTIQSAADAAAYSAAVAYSQGDTGSTALTTQAQAVVAEYVKTSGWVIGTGNDQINVPPPQVIPNYEGSGNIAIKVTATRPQLPILSSLWYKNSFNVGGSAIAIISGGGAGSSGNCLLALGNTATGNNAPDAIQVQGGGGTININVPGCGVFSNSTDCTQGSFSVELGGNAKVNAGSLGSAGCIDVFGNANITLPSGVGYTQNGAAVNDPYAGTPMPTSPSSPCVNPTYPDTRTTSKLANGHYPMALPPGRYCSLTTDPTGAHVGTYDITLGAGVYIFDSQSTSTSTLVVKNGSLTGTDVTLAFTSSNGKYPDPKHNNMMEIDANGTVNLTAPTTGATEGFVMMGDPNMPLGTAFNNQANNTVSMTGTMYLPNGAVTWYGNPDTGSTECLRAVVNTISMHGDSSFSNANCNNLYGGGGGPPIGSKITLVN